MSEKTPQTTRVLLVRHAVTAETGSVLTGRAPGVDLSEEGRAQAKALAERLAVLPVSAVYSSPIERTLETAQIVADVLGFEVQRLDGVIEADYGEWTGRRLDELAGTDFWRRVQFLPSQVAFPGGESIRAMQSRAVDAVDAVASRHRGELVVIVSHSDVIKAVVAHTLGLGLDMFQRLVVAPVSVTGLVLGEGPPALVVFGDTGSLESLVPTSNTERGNGRGGRAAQAESDEAGEAS